MSPFARRLQRSVKIMTVEGTVPTVPLSVSAIAGNATVYVYFDPPADSGSSPITTYMATASPGGLSASGASPITVGGLTNGITYTFTVHATNSAGNSPESVASNAVTPSAPVQPASITVSTNVVGAGV